MLEEFYAEALKELIADMENNGFHGTVHRSVNPSNPKTVLIEIEVRPARGYY